MFETFVWSDNQSPEKTPGLSPEESGTTSLENLNRKGPVLVHSSPVSSYVAERQKILKAVLDYAKTLNW